MVVLNAGYATVLADINGPFFGPLLDGPLLKSSSSSLLLETA